MLIKVPQQRYSYRGRRAKPTHWQTARNFTTLVDLGSRAEMAQHKSFTVDTEVKVYFAIRRCPWRRGSNENTNGLLRQYFLNEPTCQRILKKNSTKWHSN